MKRGQGKDARGRRLSAQERKLWSGITKSVAPLRPASRSGSEPATPDDGAAEPMPEKSVGARVERPAAKSSSAPPLAPLDRRLRQRVARGTRPIDGRIDLHGMTQAAAHAALLRFIRRAQADGARIVLVITGKGGRAEDSTRERGILRRQVPLWLALPEFRDCVVGYETAHLAHGGEGAIYVSIRRRREPVRG